MQLSKGTNATGHTDILCLVSLSGCLRVTAGPPPGHALSPCHPDFRALCVPNFITLRATGEQRNSFHHCEAKAQVNSVRLSERIRNWISGPSVLHNVILPKGKEKTEVTYCGSESIRSEMFIY